MNKPKPNVVWRVLEGKSEYSHLKPVAHYTNKADAVKSAQSLSLHAGKYVGYCVDSIEVY